MQNTTEDDFTENDFNWIYFYFGYGVESADFLVDGYWVQKYTDQLPAEIDKVTVHICGGNRTHYEYQREKPGSGFQKLATIILRTCSFYSRNLDFKPDVSIRSNHCNLLEKIVVDLVEYRSAKVLPYSRYKQVIYFLSQKALAHLPLSSAQRKRLKWN